MMTEEIEVIEQVEEEKEEMSSFNHSYICLQTILQLTQNPAIIPLPELTLDIDKGLTPDISVFPKAQIKTNFFHAHVIHLNCVLCHRWRWIIHAI